MKKNKDLKLLRKSIKHWCLDIRRPFLDGDKISDRYNTWNSNGGNIKMFRDDCALCQNYSCALCQNYSCEMCPLCKIDEECSDDDSAYAAFYYALDLKSANNMIAVLIKAYWVTMSEENNGV